MVIVWIGKVNAVRRPMRDLSEDQLSHYRETSDPGKGSKTGKEIKEVTYKRGKLRH